MIVGISGRIGSGKSTIGRALAARLSAKFVSFGDYVRHLARERNLAESDRQALQDLGQALVTGDARAFVRDALTWAGVHDGDTVVLDGVRHSSVWDAVRTFAAAQHQTAKLIFVEMAEHERQARLASRGLSPKQAVTQDYHESEFDAHNRLSDIADLHVQAQKDSVAMLASIMQNLVTV